MFIFLNVFVSSYLLAGNDDIDLFDDDEYEYISPSKSYPLSGVYNSEGTYGYHWKVPKGHPYRNGPTLTYRASLLKKYSKYQDDFSDPKITGFVYGFGAKLSGKVFRYFDEEENDYFFVSDFVDNTLSFIDPYGAEFEVDSEISLNKVLFNNTDKDSNLCHATVGMGSDINIAGQFFKGDIIGEPDVIDASFGPTIGTFCESKNALNFLLVTASPQIKNHSEFKRTDVFGELGLHYLGEHGEISFSLGRSVLNIGKNGESEIYSLAADVGFAIPRSDAGLGFRLEYIANTEDKRASALRVALHVTEFFKGSTVYKENYKKTINRYPDEDEDGSGVEANY